jgi:tetratricopeptide (TPR) repeat protein
MKNICLAGLLGIFLLLGLVSSVYAQSPQEALNQYITDLQKSPNDSASREKIIKHVQMMKQKPAVPSEVIRYEGAAEYAFKNAKNESDYLDSAKEYEKALLIAPWLARDYFNCGVAYEKAGRFKEAINSFNFYLIATPDAKDTNVVLKRIGGLEYADKRTTKESTPPAIAEKPKADLDLSGRWRYTSTSICVTDFHYEYQLDGDRLSETFIAEEVLTDKSCRELVRANRDKVRIYKRIGKNEFSYSAPLGMVKIEFFGDKAFLIGPTFGGGTETATLGRER